MSDSTKNTFTVWPQLMIFMALFLALLRKINDPDIWFHMVIGRETLKQWAIPQTEFYIFPMLGTPAEFHEFGFGVFYQLVYNLGGFPGMAIANALLASTALFCLYCAVSNTKSKFNVPALLVLGLTAFYIDFRLVYRPETILFMFMAIEILCLERFAASSQIKWLWPIPFAAWALSQMHPSSLFMIGVLGIYFCQFIWQNQQLKLSRQHLIRIFITVAVATLILASINPFGPKQVYLPLLTIFSSMELQNTIIEFLPVLQTEFKYHFVAIALSGALTIWLLPHRRIADTLLYVIFGWLAYRYARNLGLFAIVMYVPTACLAQHLSQKYLGKIEARFALISLPAALTILVVQPVIQGQWGIGPNEDSFPKKSVQVLQSILREGNVLNFYPLGGYLSWALGNYFKVAVDGHYMEHNKSVQFHDYVFLAESNWQTMLDNYQVNAIVTPTTLPFSGKPIPLLITLVHNNDWALVSTENSAMLFIRKTVLPNNIQELDKKIIWQKMLAEAQKNAAEYPENPGSYKALGIAYRAMDDRENARINEQKYQQRLAKNAH